MTRQQRRKLERDEAKVEEKKTKGTYVEPEVHEPRPPITERTKAAIVATTLLAFGRL